MSDIRIRNATVQDAPSILMLIKALADFEKLAHEVVATEEDLRKTLFNDRPSAEVVIAEDRSSGSWNVVGFALFFTSYSTFLGKPGIYLEDLFVLPEVRSKGIGKLLLAHLAKLAVDRNCGRLEWSVLDWNRRARDFYERLGAKPMEEWTVHRLTGTPLKGLAKESL